MAIKLVAFDWNGTILSDTVACTAASNGVFKTCKQKPITVKTFRQTFKIPATKFYVINGIQEKLIRDNPEWFSKTFIKFYEPLAKYCRTRGGVREILKWLKKINVSPIIFSNHTCDSIVGHLNRLGIHNTFEEIIGHHLRENTHHKNLSMNFKEAKLLRYVKQKRLKPKEVIVVGDTEEEIDIGRAQGFHTVAISGGYNSTNRLKAAKPDFLINNMLELKKIIQKLNNL